MVNIKTADLTNQTQKFIAVLVLGFVLILLWFLLPPFIVILQNLWLAALLGLPLVFLIYNYELVWSLFKKLSWEMTKKVISSDRLWHMYQYYYYMEKKIEELDQNVQKVGSIESSIKRSVNQMIADCEKEKSIATRYESDPNSQLKLKVSKGKIGLLQKQIDNFLPRLEYTTAQKKALIELCSAWRADTDLLKTTLDAKAEEYTLMKQLSEASDSAKSFLQKDSPELKIYNESLKQIEKSLSDYTSNVENFQRQAIPVISRINTESAIYEDEGAKLIEEYKAKRLSL